MIAYIVPQLISNEVCNQHPEKNLKALNVLFQYDRNEACITIPGDLRRQRQHRAGGGDQGHPGHVEGQRPICRVDQKIQLRKHRLRQ